MDNGLAKSAQDLKAAEAAARVAARRQAAARQEARQEARKAARAAAVKAAAVKAAAVKAAAARAARQQQAAAAPAAVAQPATPSGSPQQIAAGMLGSYGWSSSQFSCLQPLWNAESGWNVSATNTSSGAYGIPQALPGSKMASAGADWQTDAATQIRWGLGYIRSVYGSPCGAWSHEQAYGWY
jgi:pyruvate/2-oxoglutarate dehydrogenase complex dihydrolipoamide acyltransferase (E2) component